MKFVLEAPVNLPAAKRIDTLNGRFYKTPSGLMLPSITTVLSADPEKEVALSKWRKRIGEEQAAAISNLASSRGQRLHEAIENYILHGSLPAADRPITRVMLSKCSKLLNTHVDVVQGIELQLFSETIGVAGTTDLKCRWDGIEAVVDWKTAGREKDEGWIRNYFVQATAYAIMYEELTGVHVPRVVIVMVGTDGGWCRHWVRDRDEYVDDLLAAIERYEKWRAK